MEWEMRPPVLPLWRLSSAERCLDKQWDLSMGQKTSCAAPLPQLADAYSIPQGSGLAPSPLGDLLRDGTSSTVLSQSSVGTRELGAQIPKAVQLGHKMGGLGSCSLL